MAKPNLTRRNFLVRTVQGAASLAAVRLLGQEQKSPTAGEKATSVSQPIKRGLGRTGIELPVVSMGVMNADNPALVRRALELGIRHLDTAAYYENGRNEEMVGAMVKEQNLRQQTVITSKVFVPPERRRDDPVKIKEFYLKTAEASLRRLQTDYIDILLAHNLQHPAELSNPGVLEALQTMKKQGKARFIGFSVHTRMAEMIQEAVRVGWPEAILTTYNYSLADDQPLAQAISAAAAKGIGLIAMKTQCSQYWYKEEKPAEMKQKFYDGQLLQTALLKWALHNPAFATAVPGCTTFQQLELDWPVVYDLEYTAKEKEFLSQRGLNMALAYCRQCQSCTSSCPRGVDIPTLMRVHMYMACYNNFSLARQTYDDLLKHKNLTVCSDCSHCRARCVNHIDIDKRLGDLHTLFC